MSSREHPSSTAESQLGKKPLTCPRPGLCELAALPLLQLTSPPSAARVLEAPRAALPEELWGRGGCRSSTKHTEPEPCQKMGAADCSRNVPSVRILWHRPASPTRAPGCWEEGRGTALARSRRIHVVAGEAVRVLDDPLLVDVHEDLLAADGADAVGEVLGGHPRGAVELRRAEQRGRDGHGGARIPHPPGAAQL